MFNQRMKRYNILIPHAWERGNIKTLQPFKGDEMEEERTLLEIGEACKGIASRKAHSGKDKTSSGEGS